MKDLFKSAQNAKETKNLKSWAVKLPEETIDELEKLFKLSGARYKNEFIEKMVKEQKFQLSSEFEGESDSFIHPDISNATSNDLKEINRLTQNIRSIYMTQAEKLSTMQYEIEQLKKEIMLLKSNTSQTVVNDCLLIRSKKDIGNQLFLGIAGVGKTYAMSLEIKKAIQQGKKVVAIDLQGEYQGLTEHFGGSHISLGKDCLNPFEFYTNDESDYKLNEKITDVLSFVELLINRSIPSKERNMLLNAIVKTYNQLGFEIDEYTENDTFPTLFDLEKMLRTLGKEMFELADDLSPYTFGFLADFNDQRNVEIVETPFLHFDLHNLGMEIRTVGVFHVLEFIYMMIRNGLLNDSVFVFDETWVLHDNQCVRLFQKILHFGNQAGIRFMISTQQTAEFYNHFDYLLPYFDTTVCFKQSRNDLNYIKMHLDIDRNALDFLKTAQQGDCIVFSKSDFPFFMKYPEDKEIAVLVNPLLRDSF